MKRIRRSTEQLISDLEAKIVSIKARAERQKMKADPALRHTSSALKSLDKALAETRDTATRQALSEARATLSACLSLHGVASSNGTVLTPRTRRTAGGRIGEEALLEYVRSNPGQRGEVIAEALGTDTKTMRPVMRKLIEGGMVRTRGAKRGMTYSAV
jgi:hypothetical protein